MEPWSKSPTLVEAKFQQTPRPYIHRNQENRSLNESKRPTTTNLTRKSVLGRVIPPMLLSIEPKFPLSTLQDNRPKSTAANTSRNHNPYSKLGNITPAQKMLNYLIRKG
jgi:hypothetical protein